MHSPLMDTDWKLQFYTGISTTQYDVAEIYVPSLSRLCFAFGALPIFCINLCFKYNEVADDDDDNNYQH